MKDRFLGVELRRIRDLKRRKIIEVSDDFFDFMDEFKRQKEHELGIKLSHPKASELLLRKINGKV